MDGLWVRTRAGLLALMTLLATMTALAVSVSPAAAEIKEEHFCWEVTLSGIASACSNSAHVRSYYTVKIEAHSTNSPFCLQAQFGQQCGAAGQWISVNTRSNGQPTYQEPTISNSNGSKTTVVKGILYSEPPPPPPPPSWHYQEVAGEFLGKPSIARSEEASTSIFVEGLDGNLWQNWTTGVGWSGWGNVSAITGGPISGGPSSAGKSGEVNVVAKLPDGTVGFWTGTNVWGFSGIGGGQILGDPGVAIKHVFVRGLDGNLWQKWWTGSYWTEWQNLSAVVGGPIASSPSAVSAETGWLTVAARLSNNHVGIWSWSGSAWTFQQLPGEIQGDPAIASAAWRSVSVFAQGLDGNLWQISTPGVGWTSWQQITSTPIKSSPSAAGQIGGAHGGEYDVVARSAANQVGVWWYAP